MSGISRRQFLKRTGLVGGGAALGGVVSLGVDPAPLRAAKLVNLEGNPDSPISRGNLCPKGAAAFQLTVNPERRTKALHRKPGATAWEEIELEHAMDLIAQ